jgi:hypothetical protein
LQVSEPNRIYRNSIDLIIGVIVGASFLSIEGVFVPFWNIFFDLHQAVNAAGIALAYFIVITGWVGYHRSVTIRPHLGNLGMLRYGIDLLILFFWYYIVTTAPPDSPTRYGELFLWVLPTVFTLYLIWDVVKYFEYSRQPEDERVNPKRMRSTLNAWVGFAAMSLIYHAMNLYHLHLFNLTYWDNKTSIDWIFIAATFVITFLYRYDKRDVTRTPEIDESNEQT